MSPDSITCSLGACGLEPRKPMESLLMLDAAQPVSEPTYPTVGNAGLMSFRWWAGCFYMLEASLIGVHMSANTWAASTHATPDIKEPHPHGDARTTRPILLVGGISQGPSTISIPIVIVLGDLCAVSNSSRVLIL